MLLGASPDRRWIFFANDPMGSQSIIADGVRLQVVAARGGRPRELLPTLAYDDYRTWCGGRLVLTAGGDRIATTNKWLATLAPPGWRPRVLQRTGAWGSTACARDGKSVVAQSQAASDDGNFFHTHWALWRVGFDGSLRRLTSPPPGYADESPQFAGGTLYFVRSHHGVGKLYALRRGKLLGPLLSLGFDLGYYGHHGWQYSVRR
jgi:hypothetical protein